MKKRSVIIMSILIFLCILIFSSVNLQDYIKISLYPFLKNIEKYRILNNVKDYDVYETEHFIIRHNNNKAAKMTQEIIDKYYADICDMYKYYPDKKFDIIIYNDGEELLKNVGLDKDRPPLGVYYSGTINVLSPMEWIKDDNNIKDIYEEKGPIVHELTHLIVDELTNGNYPMWLTEGLALYTEYLTTGFEWGEKLSYNNKVSVENLNKDFNGIDQTIAYRKSFEVVKNISDNWGFEKVKLMLTDLGEGNTIHKTVKVVLKINLNDIE
ncbi:MAG: hypothetical protein FH751_08715 [Firmicutes bacterium]|nr:hypothetical protein [Bacillota bacterium]